jgi:hypothetical protein
LGARRGYAQYFSQADFVIDNEMIVSRDWEMSLQKLMMSSILGSGSDELTKFMSMSLL